MLTPMRHMAGTYEAGVDPTNQNDFLVFQGEGGEAVGGGRGAIDIKASNMVEYAP